MIECAHCGSSAWDPMDPDDCNRIGVDISQGEDYFWVSMNCCECGCSNDIKFDLAEVELGDGNILIPD